jgi:acyl-homoserine lactone acylase PvdQ
LIFPILKIAGILPTGQSGNPLSPHYNDQAEIYNAGILENDAQ